MYYSYMPAPTYTFSVGAHSAAFNIGDFGGEDFFARFWPTIFHPASTVIEKAQAIIRDDKQMSAGTKSMFET